MSLLEVMLDDRRIMLALAVTLAPLVLAALLGVVIQVRQIARRRAAPRSVEDEARALAASVGVDAPDELPGAGEFVAPAVREIAASTPDARDAGEPPSEARDESAGDTAPSAIQALLDSVFTEEAATHALEHLLDELDDIQADDLAALAERIAGQLEQTEA